MQFSDITTKSGIIQRCEALTLLGDGGISNNATLLKQFTGYINSAYFEVWMAQMSVDRLAKVDDYNYTDFPDAPITLVLDQADYTIPVATTGANLATFLRLNGVYLLKDGERTYLTLMEDNGSVTTTSGMPTQYKRHGESIIFNCPPNAATLSDYTNFYFEFQRVPDAFVSTDTTQEPGFMETYHDLLPLKASATYLLPTNPNLANMYEQRFLTRLELFKRDYANMDDHIPKRFRSKMESNK